MIDIFDLINIAYNFHTDYCNFIHLFINFTMCVSFFVSEFVIDTEIFFPNGNSFMRMYSVCVSQCCEYSICHVL